jgi:tetratricopeptide (TPR) repeat protein
VVFNANVRLFPKSWNAYDSYGEALAKVGQKQRAIEMYRRSILLNPDNSSGKKALDQLVRTG